jgi:hypothetical protein
LQHAFARHLRVLEPNGRLLLIDFGGPKRERHSLIGHLRAHCNFDVFDLISTINESGLADLKLYHRNEDWARDLKPPKPEADQPKTTCRSTRKPQKTRLRLIFLRECRLAADIGGVNLPNIKTMGVNQS